VTENAFVIRNAERCVIPGLTEKVEQAQATSCATAYGLAVIAMLPLSSSVISHWSVKSSDLVSM
jgi:hypothetical protein